MPEGFYQGGSGIVKEIIDGDTLILEDGREVRLVGIQAPKLPLGRPNFKAWPLADASKNALSKMVLGKSVTLHFGGRETDRYNRLLAHLFREDGVWVQKEMLQEGLARVYSFPDNRSGLEELFEAETKAREENKGLWAHPFYKIYCHYEARGLIDNFGLVQGRVLEVATVKGVNYLNFGEDYREDFTIRVTKANLKNFGNPEILADMKNKVVEVRGWVEFRGGAMIDVSHPEQIKVLTSTQAYSRCDDNNELE